MVGLVSLLVIGPERLPKVARLAGFWLGKTRNMVATFKEEIKQELEAEEIRQIMKEQSDIQQEFKQVLDKASHSMHSLQSPIEQTREQDDAQKKSSHDSE